MTENERELPRSEIRRRMDETIRQLHEQGPDPPPLAATAPRPRKRLNFWVFGGLGLLIAAELVVMGVVSRVEQFDITPPVASTPCDSALAVVEAGVSEFRLAQGSLPASLQHLVPTYLPGLPKPGGQEVKYEAQGEGFVLSCVEAG